MPFGSSTGISGDVFDWQGSINSASDFPTSEEVETGWAYFIESDVTDNDASRTNTGSSFKNSDEIVWSGSTWKEIGRRYTDSEAVAAMGAKADDNPLNHDRPTAATPSAAGLMPAADKAKSDRMENVHAIPSTSGDITVDGGNGDQQTLSITDTTDLGFDLSSGEWVLLVINMTGSQTVTWNGDGDGDGVDIWQDQAVVTLTADGEDHVLVYNVGGTICARYTEDIGAAS